MYAEGVVLKNIVYLDNSATTKPSENSIKAVNEAMEKYWGNPSSLHSLGLDAEIKVTQARGIIAKLINAREDEIIFTGSGTEANNTAINAAFSKIKLGNKIITSKIEHPSVLETLKKLGEKGFEIVTIDCDSDGIINLKQLEQALDSKTVLVSSMLVNNEVGSVQPIKEAVALTRKLSPNAYFHCDAVQAFGKMPLNIKELGVDMLSASGHKVHAPKGIGFLYLKKGVHIPPFIIGGGQEKGLRSGTESVPLICGFSAAVQDIFKIEERLDYIKELNDYAREKFLESGFIEINSPPCALPYILNISVLGFRSETLLHFLESKNIFVSSGSACAKGETSYVLSALGLNKQRVDSALRLSFSKENTKEDIDLFLETLKLAVSRLRRSNI